MYWLLTILEWLQLAMILDLFWNSKYSLKKLPFFLLGTWNFFAMQYSSIVLARWNFLHSFLSLIHRNFFGIISKFQILFKKLNTVYFLKINFRHRYSFIVLSLQYFLVVINLFNSEHSFLLSMSRDLLEFICKFQIVFENMAYTAFNTTWRHLCNTQICLWNSIFHW